MARRFFSFFKSRMAPRSRPDPGGPESSNAGVSTVLQDGDLQIADRAVALNPRDYSAHVNRGSIMRKLMKFDDALASYEQAVLIKPDHPETYFYRGVVLHQIGRYEEALESYEKAIQLAPAGSLPYVAYSSRGYSLLALNRYQWALESFDQAIAVRGDYLEALQGRGLALHQLGRPHEALNSYEQVISRKSDYAGAHVHAGNVFLELRRYREATASYDRAIECGAAAPQVFRSRGLALRQQKRLEESLASYARAIDLDGGCAEVYVDRANVLLEMGRYEDAIANYDSALQIHPKLFDALQGRGFALLNLGRIEAAIACLDQAIASNPECKYLLGVRRHLQMQVCDWKDLDVDLERLTTGLSAGEALSTPFPLLSLIDSPSLHRSAAKLWAEAQFPQDLSLGPISKRGSAGKIHIAYFSPDFRNHPISLLTAELFETHDRSRFVITAFSFGPESHDAVYARLERAFDRVIDVRRKSDLEVAELARTIGVDVGVDLAGFTEHCRTGIFALRAAPIQVGYLGYLGSMCAPYMDYILADATIIPSHEQLHYSEKIIYLPSYQANDSKRRICDRRFTRQDLGLPPEGFVFACFNANYKITPTTFSVWMRILRRVPSSALFLYAGDQLAETNIRKEAERRSIDPHRIVFGEKLPFEEYLARFRAMDLFLDTLPYNAGTTASDALWAGLPVITCMGRAFAGRVAGSVLTAINLPELITSTAAHYEELAVKLATDPSMLASVREKLAVNRLAAPLFNTVQFTRNLENAYITVMDRYDRQLPPEHIYVASAR
jgi:predicted O-linked N-acetylglucosamine transferase (SPINDLY family)